MDAPVAVDIENSAETITLVGVSSPTETWTRDWGPVARREVSDLMAGTGYKIAHNWMHELKYFGRSGVEVKPPIWDTMIANQVLQPDLHKGLEKCVTLYCDARPFKHLSTSDPARPAHDAFWTRRIFDAQYKLMEEEGMLQLFEEVIMPTIPILLEVSLRGIRVDTGGGWRDALREERDIACAEWHKLAGQLSPMGPRAVVFAYKNHRIPEMNRARAAIAALELPTFANGRAHPSYLFSSGDDIEGRIVSNDPSLDELNYGQRRIFVSDEGYEFTETLYDELPLRVAADLSGESGIIQFGSRGFKPMQGGLPVHEGVGVVESSVLSCALSGKGDRWLTGHLSSSGYPLGEGEAKILMDEFARSYPRFWAWRRGTQDDAKRGWLRNRYGRKRHFYASSSQLESPYWLIQSTVNDAMLHDLHKIVKSGVTVVAVLKNGFLTYGDVPELSYPTKKRTGTNWGLL